MAVTTLMGASESLSEASSGPLRLDGGCTLPNLPPGYKMQDSRPPAHPVTSEQHPALDASGDTEQLTARGWQPCDNQPNGAPKARNILSLGRELFRIRRSVTESNQHMGYTLGADTGRGVSPLQGLGIVMRESPGLTPGAMDLPPLRGSGRRLESHEAP